MSIYYYSLFNELPDANHFMNVPLTRARHCQSTNGSWRSESNAQHMELLHVLMVKSIVACEAQIKQQCKLYLHGASLRN